MSGRKTFTAGEVLQAADVNDYLMDQSVMVFAGTAARGSAIPSPTEGMVTYRSDDDAVEVYDGSSWNAVGPGKILQVVSTTKTDTFSASVASGALSGDVTGLTVTITPSSASNKLFVMYHASVGSSTNAHKVVLYRDGSLSDFVGDQPASQRQLTSEIRVADTSGATSQGVMFLDDADSTSATTYSIRLGHDAGTTQTMYLNRSGSDGSGRTASSITVMEVAG